MTNAAHIAASLLAALLAHGASSAFAASTMRDGAMVRTAADGAAEASPPAQPAPAAAFVPSWDRSKSIKEAAQRIGVMHRTKGPRAVYQFIDACYRTHSLASAYGEALESCFVQDYLETKMLVQIYSRMPVEALDKVGAARPEALVQAMDMRMAAALKTYEMPSSHAVDLQRQVDELGLPAFLAIVFPEAMKEHEERQKQTPPSEKKQK